MLTQERLKEFLNYCPDTGDFTWIKFKKGTTLGDVAGNLDRSGYIIILFDSKKYRAHRLASLFMKGRFPPDCIDHIDRVKHNNQWKNLREVTQRENCKNLPISKRNTSGFNGVSWSKSSRKWTAKINVDGRQTYLGCFDDINDAIAARKKSNLEHGYHASHGG